MYSYKQLETRLHAIGLNKSDLSTNLGISSRTIAKISKGEKIATNVLKKISNFLGCKIEDLFTEILDNHILQILRDEKNAKIKGGLYHETQVRMTYNSNHIEGSKLSEDDTRLIFETRTILPLGEAVSVDDVIETSNHFRCIDYAIDKALESLNEDIIAFHAEFEYIHPFQDGNGRVGRLIAFKECLRWNIIPFIIEESKKAFYYRGLTNWKQEKGWLIDTCLDGQDTFKGILRMLDIPETKQ